MNQHIPYVIVEISLIIKLKDVTGLLPGSAMSFLPYFAKKKQEHIFAAKNEKNEKSVGLSASS